MVELVTSLVENVHARKDLLDHYVKIFVPKVLTEKAVALNVVAKMVYATHKQALVHANQVGWGTFVQIVVTQAHLDQTAPSNVNASTALHATTYPVTVSALPAILDQPV